MRLVKHWNKLPRGGRFPSPGNMLSMDWYHDVPSHGAVTDLSWSVTDQRAIQMTPGVLTVLPKQMSTAIWDALTSLDWFVGGTWVSYKTYQRYSSSMQVTSRLEHLRLYRAVMALHLSQALGFLFGGGKHSQYWQGLHQQEEFRHLQCMKSYK